MKKLICLFVCSIIFFGNIFSSAAFCKKGYTGEVVKKVQQVLVSKGYGVGSHGANGIFGGDTEAAVKRFQKDHGLQPDGMVGPATQKVLFGGAKKISRTLRQGDKGEDVKLLQQALISKGYSVGSSGADGSFGPATTTAVKQFQQEHNLAVDGIAGPATRATLENSGPRSSVGVLTQGTSGADVKSIQQKLIGIGYNLGPSGADGSFGPATVSAIKQFQKDSGLPVDGVLTKETRSSLVKSNFMAATYELDRGYTIRVDQPTSGRGKPHFHIKRKNKDLGIENVDGTSSHDGLSSEIPKDIIEKARNHPKVREEREKLEEKKRAEEKAKKEQEAKQQNSKSQHAKKSLADDFQKALNHAGQVANRALEQGGNAMAGVAGAAGAIAALGALLVLI